MENLFTKSQKIMTKEDIDKYRLNHGGHVYSASFELKELGTTHYFIFKLMTRSQKLEMITEIGDDVDVKKTQEIISTDVLGLHIRKCILNMDLDESDFIEDDEDLNTNPTSFIIHVYTTITMAEEASNLKVEFIDNFAENESDFVLDEEIEKEKLFIDLKSKLTEYRVTNPFCLYIKINNGFNDCIYVIINKMNNRDSLFIKSYWLKYAEATWLELIVNKIGNATHLKMINLAYDGYLEINSDIFSTTYSQTYTDEQADGVNEYINLMNLINDFNITIRIAKAVTRVKEIDDIYKKYILYVYRGYDYEELPWTYRAYITQGIEADFQTTNVINFDLNMLNTDNVDKLFGSKVNIEDIKDIIMTYSMLNK